MSWNPLDSDITESSLWRCQDDQIRLAWVAIIAKKHHRSHRIQMNAWKLSEWARIPEEKAVEAIRIFCEKDPRSGSKKEDGRRLVDLGNGEYLVVTGPEYAKKMAGDVNRENTKENMAALRADRKSNGASPPRSVFTKPSIDELKLLMAKSGMPESEAEAFFNYYESNGWKVGRNRMVSVPHAVGNWKKNYDERRATNRGANSRASVIAERNSTISGVSEVQRRLLERDAEEAERRKQGILVNPFAPKP